jgi:hypothetical protein
MFIINKQFSYLNNKVTETYAIIITVFFYVAYLHLDADTSTNHYPKDFSTFPCTVE